MLVDDTQIAKWPELRVALVTLACEVKNKYLAVNEEVVAKSCSELWVNPDVGEGTELLRRLINRLCPQKSKQEVLVEMGLPGLIAGLGLLWSALHRGLRGLTLPQPAAGAALASLAAITGLLTQGITDTIFFRPEVQLIGWFCLATLAAQPSEA